MEEFDDFINIQKRSIDANGMFWREEFTQSIKKLIENNYSESIIKHYFISDIVINGEKTIVKWTKRYIPLTDEQYKEKYKTNG